jgi:hypothetical protein
LLGMGLALIALMVGSFLLDRWYRKELVKEAIREMQTEPSK